MKQFFNYLYYKVYCFYRMPEMYRELQAFKIVLVFKSFLGYNIIILINYFLYESIYVEKRYLFFIIGSWIVFTELKAKRKKLIPTLNNLYKNYDKRTKLLDSIVLVSLLILLIFIPIATSVFGYTNEY